MADEGVNFPLGTDGKRSTSEIGKTLFAESTKVVSKDYAERVLAEQKWRFKYAKYVVEHVELSAKSPQNAVNIATAGLAKVHDLFVFNRDGKQMKFSEAMKKIEGSFETGILKGSKERPTNFELEVPYNGKILKGAELQIQVEKWVQRGTIELSCGNAINLVAQQTQWLDLSGHYFVLLGALSAMGPLRVLLSLGANVIAVDIDRPGVWSQLLQITKNSCGTLIFPAKSKLNWETASHDDISAVAGCNLITQAPEIKNWLVSLKKDKDFTVGAYAYLDSDLFVRLSVAMDGIIQELSAARKNVALAYLCTPTDCHLIPPAAYNAQIAAYRAEAWWMSLLRVLSRGAWLTKNARKPIQTTTGDELYAADAIVIDQGPNYILAKRIQHWRCVVARQTNKQIVSSNVAPSTATVSVTKNRSFAWAYAGMHNFKPMEIFKQETSNAVMTALLLNDLNNPTSASHPNVRLSNPLQLFTHTAFHGGPWRTAHKFTTIGVPSALLYFLSLAVTYYLAAYNAVQTVGWAYIAFGSSRGSNLWGSVGTHVAFFQSLALLEIVHSIIGLVSAPALHATLQIFSRLFVVGVVSTNATTHNSPSLYLMLFAWAVTEVIRYGYFTLRQLNIENGLLKFLRYSMFIVLYPLGVYGELATTYQALPTLNATLAQVGANADFVTAMYANYFRLVKSFLNWNAADFVLYVIFPAYSLGLPFLYLHMLGQRSKALKSDTPKSGAAAAKPKQQ